MYTIKQAAIRTGVAVSLLRAWERRYGVVAPIRTPAGYRLYDDEAIARVRAMRRLVDAGWSTAQAADLVLAEGPRAADRAPTEGGGPDPSVGGTAPMRSSLLAAAQAYDVAGVERALDDLFGRGSYEAVIDDIVLPAIAALGTAWADGTLDVAGEHLASAAVLRRLAERFDHAAAARTEAAVIVGLPAGARHEVGTLAFAVALRRRGVDVLYLGPDVPAASWAVAMRDRGAVLAVVGVPRGTDVAPALETVSAVLGVNGRTRVAVGGPASGLVADGAVAPSRVIRLPDRIADAAEHVASELATGVPNGRG